MAQGRSTKIIPIIKWIQASRFWIKNFLSRRPVRRWTQESESERSKSGQPRPKLYRRRQAPLGRWHQHRARGGQRAPEAASMRLVSNAYLYIYIYIYMYMYICLHMYTYVHSYINMYIIIHIYLYKYWYIYMYIHPSICMYIYLSESEGKNLALIVVCVAS